MTSLATSTSLLALVQSEVSSHKATSSPESPSNVSHGYIQTSSRNAVNKKLFLKRSGSRPVILPSRFTNFNFFNSKTSVYFYYKIFIFQTAIVKRLNRNSYEYKNCTTDPYSGGGK
jgi:hypothetical protein